MVQIFIKDFNSSTFVLDLQDNYTISSKELFVKSLKLIFDKQNKTFEEIISNNDNFISNFYCKIMDKYVRFENQEIYFNTDKLKDTIISFNITNGSTKIISQLDKEDIKDILNGYY
jgi:hypothetical protein